MALWSRTFPISSTGSTSCRRTVRSPATGTSSTLLPFLESKNLHNGIHVTVRYKDLTGDSYQSQWRLNPFLYKDTRLVRRKGMVDLVNAVERLALSKDGSSSQTPVPEQTSDQEHGQRHA